ncbi:MAG: hypothetical protein M1821_009404 [Bathelium mastoideum]|nr:MAG: hypothetical protein M1821_009404 [Bathelium mastoideum]
MASPSHKNILLLLADDLGKYVGCYGCPSVRTPNLDRLASQGVRFTSAFASTASCSGSRSTIYTGLHTHENGQYGLRMHATHFQTFEHVDSLPKLLRDNDYLTGIVGKIHVGPPSVYNWEVVEESGTRDVAWVADQCEAFFHQARNDSKPWYLTVGFIDPHRDVTTRGGFGNQTNYDKRVPVLDVKPEDVEIPNWLSDLPETRKEFMEYYQSIHRMDAGVGMILDALEHQGFAENTLVVFTSDNGPPFVNSKTTLYEAGLNLPLIVRAPGSKPGVENSNMISFIDIFPTFLEWAGIDPATRAKNSLSPTRLGRSFLPILSQTALLDASTWQHHIFGSHTFHELQNYWPTRVLRTRKYKYHRNLAWRLDFPFAADLYASLTFEGIRNSDGPAMIGGRQLRDYIFRPAEELYDLDEDPQELHNLAPDSAHTDLLLELRKKLENWQRQTKDLWWNRDGVSLTMLARYAKDGLAIPDRLDFDVENPGTKDIKLVQLDPDDHSRVKT